MPSYVNSIISQYSPFIKEFKKRIISIALVFVISTIFGFTFYEKIIKFLVDMLGLKGINIVFTSPFQFINLAISCGISSGIVFSLPTIIYEIMSFLRPALQKKEYKTLVTFLPFSMILFALGFVSGAVLMKWQIEIFLARATSIGIGNILDISSLINVVVLTSTLMGIGFQFPIVLLVLLRLHIVTQEQLSKQRKWIYLASFIFAILLPPDSVLADFILSLPLVILFEGTLLLNRYILK